MLCTPTCIIGNRLLKRADFIKSSLEPAFKNLVVKPANGPNNNAGLPLMIRVSKWGTDMGGAPIAALPYTLAWCCLTIDSSLQTSHCPETGKPPYPMLSGMPDFCSNGKAPPPAPKKTKPALMLVLLPVSRFFNCTFHDLSLR